MTINDDSVEIRIPRGAIVSMESPPATVTQLTCERWFGIGSDVFRDMARRGEFPVRRLRRALWVACFEDVRNALLNTSPVLRLVRPEKGTKSDQSDMSEPDDSTLRELLARRVK